MMLIKTDLFERGHPLADAIRKLRLQERRSYAVAFEKWDASGNPFCIIVATPDSLRMNFAPDVAGIGTAFGVAMGETLSFATPPKDDVQFTTYYNCGPEAKKALTDAAGALQITSATDSKPQGNG
jgi:hypothetical protein